MNVSTINDRQRGVMDNVDVGKDSAIDMDLRGKLPSRESIALQR
jgi:hypothetical protein